MQKNFLWKDNFNLVLIVLLIIYFILFIANYVTSQIIKSNSFPSITDTLTNLTVIYIIGFSIWFFYSKREIIISEITEYIHDINPIIALSFGGVMAVIFLITSDRNLPFFLTLSEISFVIAGFSFTAGSFFQKQPLIKNRFFRNSVIFSIIGFLSIFYYLTIDIVNSVFKSFQNTPINIFYYPLSIGDFCIAYLAVLLFVMGFLFAIAFMQFIKLLLDLPRINMKDSKQ